MKKLVIISLFLVSITALAQPDQDLKFKEEKHDFGLIKEVDGPAEYQFDFTNTGSNPVKILNVRASCGCTTPAWTHESVLPGKTGFIKAVYNPRNRPGPFHKTLTVTTDSRQKTIVLQIEGRVEPKPRTIEDDFPTVMGGLRFKYRAFNMGKVYDNKPATKEFEVYNQSDKPIAFMDKVDAPNYIDVSYNPKEILPNQKGKVIINYNSVLRHDLGFMSDNINFYTNEEGAASKKSLAVYADINEYFAPMTPEQVALAPKLEIKEITHDFGKIDEGTTVTTSFSLQNTGKSALNIRKTHANCGCTIASLSKDVIAPGESLNLDVSFNTKGRRGNQQKSITIYTNDPVRPVQRVILKAYVQMPSNN